MSDLNDLIRNWRDDLGELSAEQRDELEDHVRAECESLMRVGLRESEAFAVAAMRCGTPSDLETEFTRADPAIAWSRRLRWMIVGILVALLFNIALNGLGNLFGIALIQRRVGLSLAIAMRFGLLSAVIFLVVCMFHVWYRKRGAALRVEAPRWLTAGWVLGTAVVVMPWLYGLLDVFVSVPSRVLHPSEHYELLFANSIVQFVLPLVLPVILLIVSVSLERKRRRPGAT